VILAVSTILSNPHSDCHRNVKRFVRVTECCDIEVLSRRTAYLCSLEEKGRSLETILESLKTLVILQNIQYIYIYIFIKLTQQLR